MALNLYRRHGSHCAGGRALHDRTYEPDELRRGWLRKHRAFANQLAEFAENRGYRLARLACQRQPHNPEGPKI